MIPSTLPCLSLSFLSISKNYFHSYYFDYLFFCCCCRYSAAACAAGSGGFVLDLHLLLFVVVVFCNKGAQNNVKEEKIQLLLPMNAIYWFHSINYKTILQHNSSAQVNSGRNTKIFQWLVALALSYSVEWPKISMTKK